MNKTRTSGARESLQPAILVFWIGSVVLLSVLLMGVLFLSSLYFDDLHYLFVPVLPLVVLVAGIVYCWLKYQAWSFELQEDGLHLSRGVIVQVDTLVPYIRIQHIDTQRGPIDRLLGLSSTVVFTAGSRGADVLIPGLARQRAIDLQNELRTIIKEEEHRLLDAV